MDPIIEFIAGIGLFLFSMNQLENNLKQFAGNRLQKHIEAKTDTKLEAIVTGTIATALLQSSSLVGLIILALCGAGLLPLFNAIGVMLGANLGTTLTGWIVTFIGFKLSLGNFALYIIGISGLLNVLVKNTKVSRFFMVMVSIGLLLVGLELMKNSAGGISDKIDLQSFRAHSSLYFLFLGIILSAVIQSSSAVMMITLSALNIQVFELHHAAALIIGADLGTTSTVLIGSLKGAAIKRQLAFSHLSFNLITNLIAFIFLLPVVYPIMQLSGIEDPLYQLVFFHSLFNLIGIGIFFPWLNYFSVKIKQIFASEPEKLTQFIHKVPVELVSVSIQALTNEVDGLIKKTLESARLSILQSEDEEQNDELSLKKYDQLKHIEGEIIRYINLIQQQKLTANETERLNQLSKSTRYAIFSIKSLNDVRLDIQNVYFINRDHKDLSLTTEFFRLYKRTLQSLEELISHQQALDETDKKLRHEELENLQIELKLHFLKNQEKLYIPEFESSLTNMELSSLLNLNKEIFTSSRNIIKAVENFMS